MRDWTGLDTASLPPPTAPDFHNRTRKMFGDIDYFLRDLSRGIGRIQNGEVPDGSGDQIGNNGTLTDYWFKPGISDPFIAYMSKSAGAGGLISSSADQTKGFINLGNTEYVDEAQKLVGINVSGPLASLHLQSGNSGTTTLVPNGDAGHTIPNIWDGYRNAASTLLGPPVYPGVNTNDDDTSWSGLNPASLGVNPMDFNMSGTITPSRIWTVTIRLRTDSGTCNQAGNVNRVQFEINDANGNKYSKTDIAGGYAVDTTGLSTTWTTYTFTIDGTGTPISSGATANTITVGLLGQQSPSIQLYIRCTYIEISTGGDSDIARWNNSSATLLGKITSAGKVGINTSSDTLTAFLTTKATAATDIVSIFKGFTAQSGNLTEWQNVSGTILSRIKSDGTFEGPISTTGAVSVQDSTFSIFDNVTPTKIAQFQCSGLSVGTRTFTFPDQNGTLPTVENTTTVSGAWTFGSPIPSVAQTFAVNIGSGSFNGTGLIIDDGSGFKGEFQGPPAGFTTDRAVFFPDAGGEIILSAASQTQTNKTMGISTILKVASGSSGTSFSDNTTATKRLRFILSGAGAFNHTITLTNTGQAHNYGLGDIQGMIPVVGDDPPAIAAGSLGKVDLTAQTAGIGSTNLSNTPPAGLYWVDVYVACTTASGSGAPTLDVNLAWTDVVGATNRNCTAEPGATAFPLSLAGTGRTSASMFMQVASGNIAYTTTINAASGTPQYAIYIRVTYLG